MVVIFTVTANAQKRSTEYELNEFLKKYKRLKVILFLSQDKVTPADTIRFHAAAYDQSGRIFTQRQILNLDLADQNGKIVHRQNALMAAGQTDSYLKIPADLPEGFFLLRAYTNWMKNFGEESFTYHVLEVVREHSLQRSVSPSFISLHPEGGKLIGGVENHIAIRYGGIPLGSPLKIVGSISGDLGTVFSATSGISTYSLKPISGEQILIKSLPSISSEAVNTFPSGVAIRLRENRMDLKVNFPSKSYSSKDLNVIILGRGTAQELQLISGYADSLIYKLPLKIKSGYYQIQVMNSDQSLIASRQWAFMENQPTARIEMEEIMKGTRAATTAELLLTDERGKPITGTFNIAVSDQRSQTGQFTESNLSLLRKFQGMMVNTSRNPKETMDDLIAVHESWIPENWSQSFYQPSYSFQSILHFSGTVSRRDRLPFRDSTTVMLFLQNKMMGYEAVIKDGKFDLPVYFDFNGSDKLFYAIHRKDSIINESILQLDRDTTTAQHAPPFTPLLSRDAFADFMVKKKATDRSYKFFQAAGGILPEEQPDLNRPYEEALQGADIVVQIDDYVVFPTLEDVIREIVPSLKYRKSGGRSLVRVFLYSPVLTNTPILSTGDPLYIIDGQMTSSTDYFMGINPADLISIRIIRNVQKLTRFGFLGRNGVVLVKTRNPEAIKNFELNSVVQVSGLNEPLPNIREANSDPRIPDLRLLLLWRTAQKTDENGRYQIKFTTGDVAGRFLIRIEGVTELGEPFYCERFFEISEK